MLNEHYERFEHQPLVGQLLSNLGDIEVEFAIDTAEDSASEHAQIMLSNITYTLERECNMSQVADYFEEISRIVVEREGSAAARAGVTWRHLMEQGVAGTIVSTLGRLECLRPPLCRNALVETLVAALDLANTSSKMRVQLVQAGILEAAAMAVKECKCEKSKQAAKAVVESLTQVCYTESCYTESSWTACVSPKSVPHKSPPMPVLLGFRGDTETKNRYLLSY